MKRKPIALLLVFMMVLTMITPVTFAEENQDIVSYTKEHMRFNEEKLSSQSTEGPFVRIWADEEYVTRGDVFSITLDIRYINDLYGASIDFKFDTEILEVVPNESGNPVIDNNGVFVTNGLNSENTAYINRIKPSDPSMIEYAITQIGVVPGFNIPDWDMLGQINFRVKDTAPMPSGVEFEVSNLISDLDNGNANVIIKLSDSNAQSINYTSEGNYVEVKDENLNILEVNDFIETRGDNVDIQGEVVLNGEAQIYIDIPIRIYKDDTLVMVEQIMTDMDGRYSVSFQLDNNQELGEYEVRISVLGQEYIDKFIVENKLVNIETNPSNVKYGNPFSGSINAENIDTDAPIIFGVFNTIDYDNKSINLYPDEAATMVVPFERINDSGVTYFEATNMNIADIGEYLVRFYDADPTVDSNANNLAASHLEVYESTQVSSDATLSDLTVSEGILLPEFNPNTTDYTVALPSGTTTVPTVNAVVNDSNAVINITDATSLSETTTIVVTAEDGVTTMTYTVGFRVEVPVEGLTIIVAAVAGLPGDTVTIPISLDEIPEDWGSMDLELEYDSNILTVEEVKSGDVTFALFESNTDIQNKIILNGVSPIKTGEGTKLFDIVFKIKEDAPLGITDITIVSESLHLVKNSDFTDMPVDIQNGYIEVIDVKYGDVNGDGEITSVDALITLKASASKYTLDPKQFKAADVNGDGKITSVDALMILKASAGKLEKFPVEL